MKRCLSCLTVVALLLLAARLHAEPALPGALQDFPRYPGAAVVQTMDTGGNLAATFEVQASADEIINFFNSKLPAQGWSKTMEARQDGGAMVSYSNGQQSLTIGVDGSSDGMNSFTLILAAP